MKSNIYCVGNAHLDPAWMWKWQEGSAEAKATIRSALDRMNEFPEFRFVCSSASVFEWIEEFDPKMFEEIKARIDEGRFIIVGGWYVQPDCNIPSGESFARQSLYSQRYFYEKFGVTAKVGYNVDSFGHNGMLPQILRKSGMDSYIFMRPSPTEKPMDSCLFNWISPDGSSVLAYRIFGRYCYNFQKYSTLKESLEALSEAAPDSLNAFPIFYGVGNHGGGPTIKNLKLLREFGEKNPDKKLVYSDLSDFFKALKEQKDFKIPDHRDDLQHHASGCYSAFSRVKTDNRKSEAALFTAEILSFINYRLLNKPFPSKAFATAWKDVNFIQFHDIAGGCCIKDAFEGERNFAGEALCIAMKAENNAAQTLSWAIDTSDSSKGTPVVFFNPNSFTVKTTAQINMQVSSVHNDKDERLAHQYVFSQTHLCDRRCDSVFRVTVPAFGYATYYVNRVGHSTLSYKTAPEIGRLKYFFSNLSQSAENAFGGNNRLEDNYFIVSFDKSIGAIDRLFDKVNKRELLAPSKEKKPSFAQRLFGKRKLNPLDGLGAVGVVIDEKAHDTWSHAKNFFDKEIGYFGNAEITLLEKGFVRTTIKTVSTYGESKLTQYFSLQNDGLLRVKVKLDWREKQKMMKLAFPLNLTETKAVYEMPFGHIVRPSDGEEECGHNWIATIGKEGGVALLNDCKYSFSVKNNVMNLTAIRSPYFADHGAPFVNKECEFTDQGESEFSYAITPFDGNYEKITKLGKGFNTPLVHVIENNHKGTLPIRLQGISLDKENIVVTCLKRAEDGNGMIIRAYETDGIKTTVTVVGTLLPVPLTAEFSPYSVNTYYLPNGGKEWKEVLLTEYNIEE